MTANERPVAKGTPLAIQASTWNAVLRMLDDWRRGRLGGAERRANRGVEPTATVHGRNATGANLPAFSVVTLGGVQTMPISSEAGRYEFARAPHLTILTPGFPGDVPAVTLEAIPAGQSGRVAVTGIVPVLCSVVAGSAGSRNVWLRCIPGNTSGLQAGEWGSARLLGRRGSSATAGTIWLPVLLGCFSPKWHEQTVIESFVSENCTVNDVVVPIFDTVWND